MSLNNLPDNLSMPACTMIPVLEYEDVAAAITWLTDKLGFAERWRAGTHRAQLSFGDSAIAIIEANPVKPIPKINIMIRVKSVVPHYDRAQQQGVEILRPPSDFPYGERQYSVSDIGGHVWTFSQTIANVVPEDWGGVSANL
ncbi:VOC family protein [Mucilaginibacter sp. UYCu711]|uniref:VOC family protein n=1 Tax=Mucilaginibacter sp. UYCu711 TaxID=3156339 RepID=UPI003D1AFECB